MSKVIYTAADAQYMVRWSEAIYDWSNTRSLGGLANLKSFRNGAEAVEFAAEQKRGNPYNEYQVVDLQAEEEN